MIQDFAYDEARRISEKIASTFDVPRFYHEKRGDVTTSRRLFEAHPMVQSMLHCVSQYENSYGHGLSHARKVAIDGGAIVLIEAHTLPRDRLHRMVLLMHLAGVLHDVKRSSPDHATEGAKEAGKILAEYSLAESERNMITRAIGNHEAFKPPQAMDTPLEQLLSDALYDADKFRWGPDNFTEMIWDIVIPRNVPLSKVLEHFEVGMEGIEKIRVTFRSSTGKEYGPDFIDRGIQIGKILHSELLNYQTS